MGWSNATGEGKTAVAPSNLSGGIYSVRPERPAWKQPRQGGKMWEYNPRHGSFLLEPQGKASCEPKRCDCSREGQDQRGSR